MTAEQAQILALQTLTFLAGDEKLFAALQAQTGINPDMLRNGADDPVLLGAILDFVLEDDRRLVTCCEAHEWDPLLPAKARRALPGVTSGIW